MRQFREGILLLTTLLIASCGVIPQSQNPENKTINTGSDKASSVKLSKTDIAELEKEYSFKTSSLSADYFRKKINKWLGADNGVANGARLIRELEFARYKTESEIPLQAMITADPALYTTLTGVAAVTTQVAGSLPFASFITGINPSRVVSTFAGDNSLLGPNSGYTDATGTSAKFNFPRQIAIDSLDNLYVAESIGNRIRKITQAGVVSTFAGDNSGLAPTAGNTDGTGTNARFNVPYGIAIDSANNLYVTEINGNRVRKITTPGAVVTTLAGDTGSASPANAYTEGNGTAARFSNIYGIAVDSSTGNVYVAEAGGHRIRKITSGGLVSTLAGDISVAAPAIGYIDGTGTNARFNNPIALTVDPATGNIYLCEAGDAQRIRKITSAGVVTTFAGINSGLTNTPGNTDGTGTNARFNGPVGVAYDSNTSMIYMIESNGNRVRKINAGGVVTTIAGDNSVASPASGYTDGSGSAARFNAPTGIAVDSAGKVYVSERTGQRIRKIQ